MKKILVLYDSEPADLQLAEEVAMAVLGCGFDPWLADNNVKRNWRTELEGEAKSSACAGAVAVWTAKSIKNNIVRDEASLISGLKLPLLGLLVDEVKHAPIGFGEGPRFNFSTSDKQSSLARLTTKIRRVFGSRDIDARALQLGGKTLAAPGMVLSVSSFETQIEPEESLKLLKLAKPPAVLVSAYDLLRPALRKSRTGRITSKPKIYDTSDIHELRADGSIIFLDSGNYESMRYSDSDWHRSKKRIFEAQEMVGADLVFTHDKLPGTLPFEKTSATERIDTVLKEYERDAKLIDCEVAPIIHAPRLKGNGYRYDLLPEVCCGVAAAARPKLIAVAERELGDGLLKRVETIAKIRKALDDQGTPVFLHVLGTGNPISTAFLSMAGADFFDGLEWCRTVIDGRRWRLYHFQQWDLLASQSGMIESDVIGKVVSSDGLEVPWVVKAALHNLAFFLQADKAIRDHHQNGELEKLFFERLELDAAFVSAREIINGVR